MLLPQVTGSGFSPAPQEANTKGHFLLMQLEGFGAQLKSQKDLQKVGRKGKEGKSKKIQKYKSGGGGEGGKRSALYSKLF